MLLQDLLDLEDLYGEITIKDFEAALGDTPTSPIWIAKLVHSEHVRLRSDK